MVLQAGQADSVLMGAGGRLRAAQSLRYVETSESSSSPRKRGSVLLSTPLTGNGFPLSRE
jgi:hypothetical protein